MKQVFNLVLKESTVSETCKSTGKLFHILGPATLNDLSAKVLCLANGILYEMASSL